MEDLKRAQELRVDEYSLYKTLRESHDTIQRLTSQIHELQERVNYMNDLREFSRYRIDLEWKLSHVPSQPAVVLSPQSMLSRDQRLPLDTWNLSEPQDLSEPQGNVFGNPRPMFDSSQRPCQGILHSTTPSAGKYRATCRKRWRTNWEHDYNSDVWEKAVNHEFFLASGNST